MDSISPLAKILAEANGIDWKSIQGSGAGGSVVEQDILNYLSRIMSGEEESPATPVDEAPPGWTGEMPPMPVARAGLEALSAAGVESDITDFVAQQSQAAHGVPVQPVLPEPVMPEPVLSEGAAPAVIVPAVIVPAVFVPASAPPEPVLASPAALSTSSDDLEFELDDLDDDLSAGDPVADNFVADDLSADDLELHSAPPALADVSSFQDTPAQTEPRPKFGSVPVYGAAALEAAGLGGVALDASDSHESVHPEQVEPEAVRPESIQHEYVQPEPVQVQQPAYDPVALDADADFVLADNLPGFPTAPPAPVVAEQSVAAGHPDMTEHAVAASLPENGGPLERAKPAGTSGVAAAAGGAAAFGLGGFLSRLYGGKARAEAVPEVSLPEARTSEALAARPVLAAPDIGEPTPHEPTLGEALIPQAPAVAGTPVMAPLVADQWRDQELTGPEVPALGLHGSELHGSGMHGAPHAELGQPTDLPEAHEAEDQAGPAPLAAEQVDAEQASHSWTDVALPLGAVAGAGAAGLAAVGLDAQEQTVTREQPGQHHGEGADARQEVAAPAHDETVHGETPVPEAATSELSAPEQSTPEAPTLDAALPPVAAPTSHTAITLRLNLDLHALETARAQLSTALMREIPLGLLVARAAARSLSTLGLHTGEGSAEGVALANHAGHPLAADLRTEFRASLEGLGHVTEAQPALLVLDASALGLDELHRGECSLSVGRAGSDGAALSLRGELDPARGAQFLHEVAGLLGTPILLLF